MRILIGMALVSSALAQQPTHPIVIPPPPLEYTPILYAAVQTIPEGGGWYVRGLGMNSAEPAILTYWLYQYTSDFNSGNLVATDVHPGTQATAQLRYGACFILTPPGATLGAALQIAKNPSTSIFPPAHPGCAIPHTPIRPNDTVTIMVN